MAFMRITASPSSSTFTRQSTRASALGSIETVCVGCWPATSANGPFAAVPAAAKRPPKSNTTCTDFFVFK